ncbi:hypothetical protein F2P81_021884 [Scophthalmus maximus]|uniref:Uncharacterized protein n=1 Tax=Scophthalmus maximus TaxID=52904 RepID=A0A6A4RSK7_SCOMX|nr:hypothetical protein F2P81_021884 [Scophthalmus maximus]
MSTNGANNSPGSSFQPEPFDPLVFALHCFDGDIGRGAARANAPWRRPAGPMAARGLASKAMADDRRFDK